MITNLQMQFYALKPNAIWTMRGDELKWQDDEYYKTNYAELRKNMMN